jgi:FkbM family methyltransferase
VNINELKRAYNRAELSKKDFIERAFQFHQTLYRYSEYLKNSGVSSIRIDEDMISMSLRHSGIELIVDPGDSRATPTELLNLGYQEQREYNFVVSILDGHETVLDVGANAGIFSLSLAKRFPHLKIYAFEPMDPTYLLLERNIRHNALRNVTPVNAAVADYEGSGALCYYPFDSGNSGFVNHKQSDQAQILNKRVTTIDAFVRTYALQIGLIKCDVEGAEFKVLQGARETLDKQKPAILLEMLRIYSRPFGYHPNEVIEYMRRLGYRCYTVQDHLTPFWEMTEDTVETNFLYLHDIVHAPFTGALQDICNGCSG